MPKKWTGDIVGIMHTHQVSGQDLADELGVTNRYVSMVLNGHRDPPGAEEKFHNALREIIIRKEAPNENPD